MKILSLIIVYMATMMSAYGASSVGKVLKSRGKVTALFPGAKEAVELKQGMSISEDTSILSGDASFAQIQMNDGSRLVIGPKSKMIVNFIKKDEGGVVSLLKGKIRSQVKKENHGKTKLLVKTRTAAMGVRGTDFQASYNPEGNLTSLVTYTGQVAMVKVDKKDEKKLAELTAKKNKSRQDLDTVFKKKKPVLVEKGTYSAVSENLEKATKPVNLNPVQFSVLKLNKNFVTKKSDISEEEIKKEVKQISKVIATRAKDNKDSADATFDAKTGEYKPREGGLIDLETGIYVPPAKDSKLDKKLGIYVDANVEKKISDDGSFLPPEGIKLDAKKGFVAEDDSDSAKAELAKLNKEIAGQIVKPKKPSFDDLEDSSDTYDKYFDYE